MSYICDEGKHTGKLSLWEEVMVRGIGGLVFDIRGPRSPSQRRSEQNSTHLFLLILIQYQSQKQILGQRERN